MPQSKVDHDFALDRLRVVSANLTQCLSDAAILGERITQARDANALVDQQLIQLPRATHAKAKH